ncbi:MAG: hypothetical protein Q4F00_10645 [bacterium]|nr:hypothetical protein [bacterium]
MPKMVRWAVLALILCLNLSCPVWADDSDFYRMVPCKFQIKDKMGRSVECPPGTTLAFQLQPGDGGVFLNGKTEIEVADCTADLNSWREATMGPNGVFEADLFAPVSDTAGSGVSYVVRFKGGGRLNTASLNVGSIILTHRGTAHDVEPLAINQSVRQKWEVPMIAVSALITLFWGWLRSAKIRARVWAELTAKADVSCDSVANSKKRFIMAIVVIAVLIGSAVALLWPGVTGFFPYCGVILGSLLPMFLVFVISVLY